MFPRLAALVAALLAVLAVPSVAAANPAVETSIVSTTNLTKLPASVTHRLSLTAGAADEVVSVGTAGGTPQVGGSAVVTIPATRVGPSVAACEGRWSAFHAPFADPGVGRVGIRIPAGTTATVDVTIELSGAPYDDETLDAAFEVEPATGTEFTVLSEAPAFRGTTVAEMSLLVIRARNNTAVVTGRAFGKSGGRVEIWAYRPGQTRARRLTTVRPDEGGQWSWANWRPDRSGRWELYARYRDRPGGPYRGATECGTLVPVRAR